MATLDHLLRLDSKNIKAIEQQPNGMVRITFKSVMQPITIPMLEEEFRKLNQRLIVLRLEAEVAAIRKDAEKELSAIKKKHQTELTALQRERDKWRRQAEKHDSAAIHAQQNSIESLNERLVRCRKSLSGLATMIGIEFPDAESEEGVIHRIKGMLKTLLDK